jgi:hypothetical protein
VSVVALGKETQEKIHMCFTSLQRRAVGAGADVCAHSRRSVSFSGLRQQRFGRCSLTRTVERILSKCARNARSVERMHMLEERDRNTRGDFSILLVIASCSLMQDVSVNRWRSFFARIDGLAQIAHRTMLGGKSGWPSRMLGSSRCFRPSLPRPFARRDGGKNGLVCFVSKATTKE